MARFDMTASAEKLYSVYRDSFIRSLEKFNLDTETKTRILETSLVWSQLADEHRQWWIDVAKEACKIFQDKWEL